MGTFHQSVRRNKQPGPNQKGFNRPAWEAASSLGDPADRRIAKAGLFFADLLTQLRNDKHLSFGVSDALLSRLAVAVVTLNYWKISNAAHEVGRTDSLSLTDVQQHQLALPSGQLFYPDELITGLGDSVRLLLRECLPRADFSAKADEQFSEQDIENVERELNVAILYQSAVEYWLDCLGNGYEVADTTEGFVLAPTDKDLEIARIASIYRRNHLETQDAVSAHMYWRKLSRQHKERLAGTGLVSSLFLTRTRIERITVGRSAKALEGIAKVVIDRIALQSGLYRSFLESPLPALGGLKLGELIKGWQLVASLAECYWNELQKAKLQSPPDILHFAPHISKAHLRGAVAKALGCAHSRADLILESLLFKGLPTEDLWTRPLVDQGDDVCMIPSCLRSIHFVRVVEGWMRQGGIDLDRRGTPFEDHCREELNDYVAKSAIKNDVTVCPRSVTFKTSSGNKEEIDLVIRLGNTILIAEIKCILWPDDALQYANFFETISGASTQLARKIEAVQNNYRAFAEALSRHGVPPPTAAVVEGCVLTNSAVYAGFSVLPASVVDLPILGRYFLNHFVKVEERDGVGRTLRQHAITFYRDAGDAESKLRTYLREPPQLTDKKAGIVPRRLQFPVELSGRKIFHDTYHVHIDTSAAVTLLSKPVPKA